MNIPFTPEMPNPRHDKSKIIGIIVIITLFVLFAWMGKGCAEDWTNEQIANAIYLAEGGAKTRFPYGILTKYKTTTPRQACINTIRHARKDWDGKGDFIEFLGSRYAPIGAKNDPGGLNKNWVRNVEYFLARLK